MRKVYITEQKELKAKLEIIDMMKAQVDKGKMRAQEFEGDLNKANKGMQLLMNNKWRPSFPASHFLPSFSLLILYRRTRFATVR
jgi:hypothetical protein